MPNTLETKPATKTVEPSISPLAGKPAPKEMLIDVARLEKEYFERKPDISDPNQFGKIPIPSRGRRSALLLRFWRPMA